MKTILRVDASISGDNGESTQLSDQLVSGLQSGLGETTLVRRNVSDGSMPHFDGQTIAAITEGNSAFADTLIEEVKQADILVIAAPMYNFAVPSQLKAWFDHITRAGVTFRYTENGPVGLLGEKKVFVIATSGSQHVGTPRDSVTPWLETILGFIGLASDLTFVRAAGLAQSQLKDQARAEARKHIQDILADLSE